MTELTIRPEEIRSAIERNVQSYSPTTAREEVGRVVETGDGIARVEGLHSAMTNELLALGASLGEQPIQPRCPAVFAPCLDLIRVARGSAAIHGRFTNRNWTEWLIATKSRDLKLAGRRAQVQRERSNF